jgi:predicted glycosyltransferase
MGALLQAQLIVSRTGYTTLMDLARIGRSALVVPTPGQEEQEYLGELHARTGRFIVQRQDRLNIAEVLESGPVNQVKEMREAGAGERLEQALQDLFALITRTGV